MPERRLKQRADKVAFCLVPDGGSGSIRRMRGFTSLTVEKNPTEYTRRYVDEAFEQTDVTSISASMDFGFDMYVGDPVHEHFAEIIDNERIGSDAVVTVYQVDFTKPHETEDGVYYCYKKDFSVMPESEGGSNDAYTYTGELRTKSQLFHCWANTDGAPSQDVETITEFAGI